MIKKFVFLFKRKSLHLISSKHIISRPQRGNGLSHIAIYRRERAREARPRISIGKKQRSRCGPNILSSPFVITEKAFLLHYLLSGSVESFEESDTTMPKQRTNRPCLFPPGVPTALLVLALLFFAAAAGLAVCYIKRWVCWHIVGLIIYVIFLSCVFPGLLLAFSWSKQKRWSSYIVNFLPHLTFPPTTWSFPTVSAHACHPAFSNRLMLPLWKSRDKKNRLTSRGKIHVLFWFSILYCWWEGFEVSLKSGPQTYCLI